MNAVLAIALTYLLGAVPFGLIISRLAGVGDIRKLGSGNIGATNVWRVAGFKIAVWVFVADIGKGALAVLMARYFVPEPGLRPDHLYVICAAAAVLGHVFPVYLGFRGGKGVNTALGAIVALLPVETLIGLGVFAVTVLLFRYVSLGSILGAISFCVVVVIEKFALKSPLETIYVYLSILVAVLIVFTHRQNIKRLSNGTENRFSFSSRQTKETDRE
ncbi:MAG: glycerol-3-phosphate 1-O-acyltransferase PlsY [Candidatus Zixiibacteriota bacterium]|nr:MAG: glycerol-3-phosphate 1-O-acyltransferase PlsY [candidate division Zixibacteria bacterium]